MIDKDEMELADAFGLNTVLLSVIDPKSYLVVVDVIEQLKSPPQTRARLLIQLNRTFESLGIDAYSSLIQPALLRLLDQCEEGSKKETP